MPIIKHDCKVCRRIAKLRKKASEVKPLIDALANGSRLQFKHNNGEYSYYNGINLQEVIMSPHRFRIAETE